MEICSKEGGECQRVESVECPIKVETGEGRVVGGGDGVEYDET